VTLRIQDYIASFRERFPFLDPMVEPWKLTTDVPRFIERFTTSLDASAFHKSAGVLVHNDATIERGAIIKPPAINLGRVLRSIDGVPAWRGVSRSRGDDWASVRGQIDNRA